MGSGTLTRTRGPAPLPYVMYTATSAEPAATHPPTRNPDLLAAARPATG